MQFFSVSFKKKNGLRRYIGPKRLFFLAMFCVFLFISWKCYRLGLLDPALLEFYHANHPISMILLFIVIYSISVMASLPTLPLNLAAGFFWGGLFGGLYSALGVTLGGWISFFLARALVGRPLVVDFPSKWANIVRLEFEKSRWKFVAFARLNPIIPTGPLNYLLGFTSLSNKDFLWTTFVFLLPPSIAVAFIGDVMQTFASQHSDVNSIIKGILIVSISVTFLVGVRFTSKILKKVKHE